MNALLGKILDAHDGVDRWERRQAVSHGIESIGTLYWECVRAFTILGKTTRMEVGQ